MLVTAVSVRGLDEHNGCTGLASLLASAQLDIGAGGPSRLAATRALFSAPSPPDQQQSPFLGRFSSWRSAAANGIR